MSQRGANPGGAASRRQRRGRTARRRPIGLHVLLAARARPGRRVRRSQGRSDPAALVGRGARDRQATAGGREVHPGARTPSSTRSRSSRTPRPGREGLLLAADALFQRGRLPVVRRGRAALPRLPEPLPDLGPGGLRPVPPRRRPRPAHGEAGPRPADGPAGAERVRERPAPLPDQPVRDGGGPTDRRGPQPPCGARVRRRVLLLTASARPPRPATGSGACSRSTPDYPEPDKILAHMCLTYGQVLRQIPSELGLDRYEYLNEACERLRTEFPGQPLGQEGAFRGAAPETPEQGAAHAAQTGQEQTGWSSDRRRHRQLNRPARSRSSRSPALCCGCASTETPRDFIDRLTDAERRRPRRARTAPGAGEGARDRGRGGRLGELPAQRADRQASRLPWKRSAPSPPRPRPPPPRSIPNRRECGWSR